MLRSNTTMYRKYIFFSFLFILPALIVYFVSMIIPIFDTIGMSMTDWDGLRATKDFFGIKNYINILSDPRFIQSILRTIIFMILHMLFGAGTGLVFAVLITSIKNKNSLNFFRIIYFLPNVLSLSVVGVLWVQIFNPDFGIINAFIRMIGLDQFALPWLGIRNMALPAITLASNWQAYGFYLVIFVAGIQLIDPQLYEAATIDGAGSFQKFINITIPSLRPIITLVLTLSLIRGLKGFGTVWAMTQGGPAFASEIVFVYIFKTAFQEGEIGKASAASVIFGIITVILAIISMRAREEGKGK